MRDFTFSQLKSVVSWLVGAVVIHDAIFAPIVVLLGVVAARSLPVWARSAAAVAFVVWGTLTVAVVNVLSGQGGKPDNDTILGRPYVVSWLALTAILVAIAAATALTRRAHPQSARPSDVNPAGAVDPYGGRDAPL